MQNTFLKLAQEINARGRKKPSLIALILMFYFGDNC